MLTLLTGPVLTNLSVSEKLRAASEYEERKMIRAAIRKIRDEQQQGKSSCLMETWASVQMMHLVTDLINSSRWLNGMYFSLRVLAS